MSSSKSVSKPLAIAAVLVAAAAVAVRCAPREPKGAKREAAKSDVAVAAQKTYVAPGDLDEYYMFSSGGHSGQVFIYGLPSMRHLATIPVFAPYSATGYGFDDETKAMLGKLTWGDVHHPALSETNGDYDGRWLFVNEMNGRIARIDLRDFKTRQILGPVPNISGVLGRTVMLDGMIANNAGTNTHVSIINVDAIAEIKVVSSGMAADLLAVVLNARSVRSKPRVHEKRKPVPS